jgi:hypothetical protein
MDEYLKNKGLKYEDLSSEERDSLTEMVNAFQQSVLTVEKVRNYVTSMKEAVEEELTKMGHEVKQDIYLKARLRNLLLLEACLSTPEKAKKKLDLALSNLGKG